MSESTLKVVFALTVFLVFGFMGMNVLLVSSKQAQERQRERWAHNMGIHRDEFVDNEPTAVAKLVGFLWIAVGIYVSVAILMGNLLWVMTL